MCACVRAVVCVCVPRDTFCCHSVFMLLLGIGCTIVGVTQPDVPVAENVVTPVAIKVMQKTKKTKKPG